MTTRWLQLVRSVMVVSMALVWSAVGTSESRAADAPQIDPQARAVVAKLGAYYAGQQSWQVEITADLNVQPVNQKSTTVTLVKVSRPRRISAVLTQGQSGLTLVNNGTDLTTYVPALKKYTVAKAPETAVDSFEGPLAMVTFGQGILFLKPLLAADPAADMLEDVTEVSYVGNEELAGVKAHHLRFVEKNVDWDLWVADGEKPAVLQIGPNVGKFLSSSGAQIPDGIKLELTIKFANWKTDATLTDADFAFATPDGAQKVDTLMGGRGEDEGPHPLVDKEAPAFTLELLAGGEVKLATHRDKEVVILDFWATWCGPCVRALPTIAEVAKEYKARGVAFYAVNIDEGPDEIKAFLEDKKLDVPVALDKGGKVASSYKVEGIPQTVIVGRDGVVRRVHIGAGADTKQKLSADLDAILSAK